jgi:hypothetical protein
MGRGGGGGGKGGGKGGGGKTFTAADKAAVNDYTGSGYYEVNQTLRQGEMHKDAAKINAALNKLPEYKETTYRVLNIYDEAKLKTYLDRHGEGKTVTYAEFLSTGKQPGTFGGGNVNLTVKGKRGRDIEGLSNFRSEKEVLFKSGSRFKVKSYKSTTQNTYGSKTTTHHIELEEI